MRNCLFFKLIAILLCATSLLGIVGGAAGALVLVEGDLYNKTVDDVIAQRVQNLAEGAAYQLASSYADQALGGCPEEMSRHSRSDLLSQNFVAYGYAILDGEGNVLESLNPELKDSTETYAVPITGQYMHLVSTETQSQLKAKEAADRANLTSRSMADDNGRTIPAEGVSINQVWFTDAQGRMIYEAYGDHNSCNSTYYYYNNGQIVSSSDASLEAQGRIGFLFSGPNGQIMYHSFLPEWEDRFTAAQIYGVMFLSHEYDFYYSTEEPGGLGTLVSENGYLRFTGYPQPEEIPVEPETPAETVPETTAESIPETLPPETVTETFAVETAPPETVPQETWYQEETYPEETAVSSASAVPEEGEAVYLETYAAEIWTEETASAETLAPETYPPETLPPETLPPETLPSETLPEETVPTGTEPVLINGKPLEFYQVNRTEFFDSTSEEWTTAKYVYLPMPELTVEIYTHRDMMEDAQYYQILRLVRQYRSYLLPLIGICLVVFGLCAVYLCTAAGRRPKTDTICADGLNRIPLDLYITLTVGAGVGIVGLTVTVLPMLLGSDFLLGCSAALGAGFACCLLFVGFCFAFVAQIKTPGGFWWRNTLCGRCIRGFMKFAIWLETFLSQKGFPGLGRLLVKIGKWIWKAALGLYRITEKGLLWAGSKIHRLSRWMGSKTARFFSMIPLTWQWMICGMALFCMVLIACNTNSEVLTLLCLAGAFTLILYGAHCFGTLLENTRKMSKGDLDTKIDEKLLIGSFRDFAGDLNNLADVAMVAAQKQLKSERMKTELITNVSHDIKTPLTSIINYVDLLQKPHTQEEGEQYLEVLERQSQRLKKLVEDLMDMSKASTGNMAVEITRVDAVESVNQALGEFADKLERAQLYPVFRHSEESLPILADGKLVWRVLSNLLGNAVKYAMPGTRIYVDLTKMNGKVILSLKNISREELNVDAEELMERFVRGDVSRNTEGSGLGLNIAKSLMELQKGQLQILVDGDLFKVTLIFPEAE